MLQILDLVQWFLVLGSAAGSGGWFLLLLPATGLPLPPELCCCAQKQGQQKVVFLPAAGELHEQVQTCHVHSGEMVEIWDGNQSQTQGPRQRASGCKSRKLDALHLIQHWMLST